MTSDIAKQIADLLNSENQLVVPYTEKKILDAADNYLFELSEDDTVVSCIECKKVQWYQFEVCHLTVNPGYRRSGYGQKMLDKAISHAQRNRARIIQCTIREDNEASSKLFRKNGFKNVSKFYYPDSGNDVEE